MRGPRPCNHEPRCSPGRTAGGGEMVSAPSLPVRPRLFAAEGGAFGRRGGPYLMLRPRTLPLLLATTHAKGLPFAGVYGDDTSSWMNTISSTPAASAPGSYPLRAGATDGVACCHNARPRQEVASARPHATAAAAAVHAKRDTRPQSLPRPPQYTYQHLLPNPRASAAAA